MRQIPIDDDMQCLLIGCGGPGNRHPDDVYIGGISIDEELGI